MSMYDNQGYDNQAQSGQSDPANPGHFGGNPNQPQQHNQVSSFIMRQKVTFMVNRYEIYLRDEAGTQGPMLAYAQQKRMSMKEQVRFYTDSSKSHEVFSFKARQVIDLGATYEITDSSGVGIGQFRKRLTRSLLNSTWDLTTADGLQARGSERNATIAIVRRIWDMIPFIGEIPVPFLFHFDFCASDGSLVMSSTKKIGLRDVYTIELPQVNGWRMDWRVAAAMAVALDALQSR